MSRKHKILSAVIRDLPASSTGSILTALLLAVLVNGVSAQEAASPRADWPTYMHDNSRAGGSPATLQPPFAQRWIIASASRSPPACRRRRSG